MARKKSDPDVSASAAPKGAKPAAGGGRRKAGRTREEAAAEADRVICEKLPELIGNLIKLAAGGFERVELKYQPAGKGPDAAKDGLVLVERKVRTAEPDRAANIYLIDRVLGRPKGSDGPVEAGGDQPKRIEIPDVDDRPEPDEAG